MNDDDALVVLSTVPVRDGHAERIARVLVEAGVAACVNVLGPVRSIYRWDGELCDDLEQQLVIKTRASRYAALEELLRREHPYDVPEILALPATLGSASYLSWLRDHTS
ncbi:MAG: divalent-cation tolerance protein CutA [Deltaproteobacteria bacterium]|nr:divalent-cation tolerance protein CutA [Deltaproteobacteria bacterium]